MERSGIPDISADESGGLKVNLGCTSWDCQLYKSSQNDMFSVSVVHHQSAPGEIPAGSG